MAMSAFRSTTRRSNGSSAEGSGVPSTPRSKKDPSPSGRGFHRRSTSMTDFSAKYLSDCSSTSEFRASYNKSSGTQTGRRSVCPSDSESDMENISLQHRQHRRWGAESEVERSSHPHATVTNSRDVDRKGLRRTLSSQDLSQNISKMKPILDRKLEIDRPEDLAEEKTIRAVYAQMKSLHPDPPSGDVGMTDFLDAMRTEVRRAVSDIRMELEESMQKSGKLSTEQNRLEPHGTDVIQAVADIRKEYSTKLEESEKRVRELWSQIAVEERRCLELSKIVKELLPTQPPAIIKTSGTHSSSNRKRPLRRKNSAEKQLVLKTLDDEALKYFEECVSISSYDCQGDSDDSLREKDNNCKPRSDVVVNEDITEKSSSKDNDCKAKTHPKGIAMGSDGVVLPWLQWGAESGGGGDKNPKQLAKKHVLGKCASSNGRLGGDNQSHRNANPKSNLSRKLAIRPTELSHLSPTTALTTWSDEDTCETTQDVPVPTNLEIRESSMAFFTVDENVVQTDDYFVDVDTKLFERIRFRCRVENGELLLCQGLFLM